MQSQRRPRLGIAALAILVVIATTPLCARDEVVPRTRTFSGLVATPFPYARPESVGVSSERLEWLADEVVKWIAKGELVGGELLIIKDDRAIFHEAYGWSDRERKIPVRRNSIWSIKSMSKPFTATATLMLVEEGKLSLDDPVSKFVPGFETGGITIHHLLSHTSGFLHDEDWYDVRSPEGSLEEMVETWPHRHPEAPIGEFHYADFNYAHLAYIVGKVAGVSIDEFLTDRIIRPQQLEDASTVFTDDPVWRSRLNPWYRWNEAAGEYDLRHAANTPGWTYYPGGWGLLMTAMDYAKFIALWMNGGTWAGTRLLSEATVAHALSRHGIFDDSFAYGYGWHLDREEGGELLAFTHSGGDGTQAGAYPDDNAIVIFMTHGRWGPWYDGFWNRVDMSGVFENRTGYGFHSFMQWRDNTEVAVSELAPAEQSDFVGNYVVTDQVNNPLQLNLLLQGVPVNRENLIPPIAFTIWEEDNLLHIRRGKLGLLSAEQYHLVPVGGDRFLIGRYDGTELVAVEPGTEIRFIRDGSGNPGRLYVAWDGNVVNSATRFAPVRDPDS